MGDIEWTTGIAKVDVDDVIVRGHRLSDLIGQVTYTDMAFLLVRERCLRTANGRCSTASWSRWPITGSRPPLSWPAP